MNKSEKKVIEDTKKFLMDKMANEPTGHDWYHVERVLNLAMHISSKEKGQINLFVVQLGALLHDIADWKFYDGDLEEGPRQAEAWLVTQKVDQKTIDAVKNIILTTSYKGAGVETKLTTIEEKIIHDADKLDALGAIGIARTFAYGGYKNRPIYDPKSRPKMHKSFEQYKANSEHTINHFYEKLLLLSGRMETKTGKHLAIRRHEFMEKFLQEFYKEWDGEI